MGESQPSSAAAELEEQQGSREGVRETQQSRRQPRRVRCGISPAVQGTAAMVVSHWQPLCLLRQRLGLAYTTVFSPFTCLSTATENLAGHKTPAGLYLTQGGRF